MSGRKAAWLLAGGVALVAIVTFLPTLGHAPVWDDTGLTVKNPYLGSLRGLYGLLVNDLWSASGTGDKSSYYRPLPMMTFWVNARVGGNTSASYHAGNIALHALSAALVLLLARAHGARRWLGPAFAGLLFAIAPLNVEPVTWIAGRFDTLGTALVLSALLVNARRPRTTAGTTSGSGAGPLAGALVGLSLFCKEAFIVAPLLLFLQDAIVLRRPLRSVARTHAVSACAVAIFLCARYLVGVMTAAAVAGTGLWAIARSFALMLLTFTHAALWPRLLSPFRPYAAPSTWTTLLVFAVVVAALALASFAVLRRRDADRPRALWFALVAYLVAFVPPSLTGPNLDMVGDRYAYFALAFAGLAVAATVDALELRVAERPLRTALLTAALAIVLFPLVLRSRLRLADWRDDMTLCRATLRDDDRNAYALYSLGYYAALERRFDEADPPLRRSLALAPRSWRTLNALCFVRLNQDKLVAARSYCQRSATINPENPRVWVNLASVELKSKNWPACIDAAMRAQYIKQAAAEPHYLAAACLANLGHLDDARAEVDRALEREPAHGGANGLLRQLRERGL